MGEIPNADIYVNGMSQYGGYEWMDNQVVEVGDPDWRVMKIRGR